MAHSYDVFQTNIIYLAFDDTNNQTYIGSSGCKIETLECNHRHWMMKKYTPSNFRCYLSLWDDEVKFMQVEQLVCTRATLELIEQEWIMRTEPTLNENTDPFDMSVRMGRIWPELKEQAIAEYQAMNRRYPLLRV